MLACTTIAELDPGIQGRDLFVPLQQDQLHEPPLGQQRFHLPWLRNPFHQRPVTTDDNNDGRFPLFHIPRPSSSPPRQKEQLDHIFVHGAPRSRYRHVFKRLQVNSRIRQEMTHARASFISNEIKTAVSRQPPSLSPSSHEPGEEQWLLRVDDTLTVNNLFKYGVQSVTQHDNEEEEKEKETTTTAFPWPRPRVPDVQDQETIKSFARMALDCYVDPARQGWVDIGDPWDVSMDIGWMESGLRGYVFASEDKKTVIVGIKGTSLKLFGTGGGPTANNDKLNDNKMFSCCCGKVDRTWWGVCGCYMGGNQCNQQCLVDDLTKDREESESYVGIGMRIPYTWELVMVRRRRATLLDTQWNLGVIWARYVGTTQWVSSGGDKAFSITRF
ncbi:putative lipase atg15 [Actinomortierella wolfii]|nr:putative lipase atg15 [Actinomortierella wolfii]